MRIVWGPLFTLITLFLCLTHVVATNLDDDYDRSQMNLEDSNSKISTSLSMENETLKSMPENISEKMEYAQKLKSERQEKGRSPYHPHLPRKPTSASRRYIFPETARSSVTRFSRRPTDSKRCPTANKCTFFTKNVCLEAVDYPLNNIMRSIRSNTEMVTALLADYKVQESGTSADEIHELVFGKYEDVQQKKYENPFQSNQIKRRSDHHFNNVEEGFTCPSQVKYARPQKARSVSGIWKYIINTGEHTQTLRLEKCSNPQSRCSFISENYRSSCVQVYSYHRLLTWDIKLGLHMDIFKVPTCCSCHVHGYAEIYPPHQKDPYSNFKETFPGVDSAITDQKDVFDEVIKPSNYVNKYSYPSYFITSLGSYTKQSPSSFASEEGFSHTESNTPIIDTSRNLSAYIVPGLRLKKPASISSPYDKVPLQHAPNTRAPGYTGTHTKSAHANGSNRPFRRDFTSDMEDSDTGNDTTFVKRYSRPSSREEIPVAKKQSERDEELDKPHRRINYNYHPIIDFFKPQASILQGELQTEKLHSSSFGANLNLWKPVTSS